MTLRLPHGRRSRNALFLVLGGALLLRLLLVPLTHMRGYTSDEKEYIHLATQLAAGNAFVDLNGDRAVRAPLFPLVLSLLVRLPWWTSLAHGLGVVLGVVVVYLGYGVAREILPDENGAVLAAAIIAVHPGLAIYSGLLQTEMMYTALLLALLLTAFRLSSAPTIPAGAAVGLLGGLAALTRAVAVGFFLLLVLIILWQGRDHWRQTLPSVTVALLCFGLTLAPWTIRNYTLFGRIVPVSTGGGGSLLLGNNPYASGGLRLHPGYETWYGERLASSGGAGRNEVERSSAEGRIAVSAIRSDPGHAIWLALKKSMIYWVYPITQTDSDTRFQWPAVLVDIVLMLGVAVGVVGPRSSGTASIAVLAAILFFWLVQVVLHAEARFRLPVVPLLAVSWGAGVLLLRRPGDLRDRLRAPGRVVALASAVLVVVAVYGVTAWMVLTGRL